MHFLPQDTNTTPPGLPPPLSRHLLGQGPRTLQGRKPQDHSAHTDHMEAKRHQSCGCLTWRCSCGLLTWAATAGRTAMSLTAPSQVGQQKLHASGTEGRSHRLTAEASLHTSPSARLSPDEVPALTTFFQGRSQMPVSPAATKGEDDGWEPAGRHTVGPGLGLSNVCRPE